MGNIKLLDIIDAQTLQRIQDAFSEATGMAALTTDMEGPVTQLSNPTEFCMNLTRPTKLGAERCNQCDLMGGKKAAETGKPSVYRCHSGLMDFAVPIIVNGEHIGSLIGGQVLTDEPNEGEFKRFAVEIGVNEDQYVKAVKKVKIKTVADIENAANLLYEVARSISVLGVQKIQIAESERHIKGILDEVHSELEKVYKLVDKNNAELKEFSEIIDKALVDSQESIELSAQTDEIIEYNKKVARQITLLGFNSSIESKKAGSFGAGFSVISQEIRRLSNESNQHNENIEDKLAEIKEVTQKNYNNFSQISNEVSNTVANMTELGKILDNIKASIDKI